MRRFAVGVLSLSLLAVGGGAAPLTDGLAAGQPRVLRVGSGQPFERPSLAAAAARDGDTIEIDAGVYTGDVAVWRASDLVVRGVGGRVRLHAAGAAAEGKAIWVVKGRNTTIENVEFVGARVPDGNGAGIRQEGAGLTLRQCRFHDNQEGLLAGGGPDSDVTIERSEFSANGAGDGQSHNIYVGAIRRFTLHASYSHHARVGHNVKTRARESFILYSRIMSEADGTSSYGVDIANGGRAYIIGNVFQQGPRSESRTVISYGAEGLRHPASALYVINNTFVNERADGAIFVFLRVPVAPVKVQNNIFAGPGTALWGSGQFDHNLVGDRPGLVDVKTFDYRLTAASKAIDAGIYPGSAHGVSLVPTFQYVPLTDAIARPIVKTIDIGAYEYPGPGQP